MRLLIYGLIVLWALTGKGQADFTISDYLKTAGDDQQLEQYLAEMDFLESHSMRPALLRETEIRLSTEGLDDAKVEDYRLRISPTNPWEVRANRLFHEQLKKKTHTQYRIAFSKALKSRYLILIDHFFLSRQVALAEEEIQYKTQLSDQIINQGYGEIDLEEMIEFEAKLGEKEIYLNELKIDLQEINQLIDLDLTGRISWDGFTITSPETITHFISVIDSANVDNLYKIEASQKVELEEQMFKVNKAEAFSNIGFLQANYEIDQGDTPQDHVGFQLGITLPIFNRDKADLARDQFEMIETKKEKQITEKMVDQEILTISEKIRSYLQLLTLIEQKLERVETLKTTLLDTSMDLPAFIKYKDYKLELLEKQAKVHRNLLINFVEYLDLKGQLAVSPLRNYLSNSLHYIDENY